VQIPCLASQIPISLTYSIGLTLSFCLFALPSQPAFFTYSPAAPVSLVLYRAHTGSLSYTKAHQGVTLMYRAKQEVYFPFHGKILEFNLNVFFVLKCPCETIKKLFTY